jgi:TolB-like protein
LKFRFADFEIDVAGHEVRRAGAIVHVEPQVFDTLVHLIRNRDRSVSKDELFDAIWHGRIVSEGTLSSRISAARRALGDSGNDQSLIRTLHKRGFRFVGEVDEDTDAPRAVTTENRPPPDDSIDAAAKFIPAEPLPLASSIAVLSPRNASGDPDRQHVMDDLTATTTSQLPVMFAAAGMGLTVLTAAAAWWILSSPWPVSSPHRKDAVALSGQGVAPSADRLKTPVASIAVLPFVNLSGDPKRDYLADGITDSLISDLAHALPGISIVSRNTAFIYKGRGADAREIGRELEVRYLLEGSVVLEQERVRVNTRLVETKEASQLWAERFDAELKSILNEGIDVPHALTGSSRADQPDVPAAARTPRRGTAQVRDARITACDL